MAVIGIIGPMGSGKSYVLNLLCDLGANVIDCDKLVRELNKVDMPLYKAIVKEFGSEYIMEDRSLNREKLKDKIFKSDEAKKRLNDISRSIVYNYLLGEIEKISGTVFVEGTRIHEAFYENLFDEYWYVFCDEDTRIDRIMKRDNVSKDTAIIRAKGQQDIVDFKDKCHKIISSMDKKLIERLFVEYAKKEK